MDVLMNILRWFAVGSVLMTIPAFFIGVIVLAIKLGLITYLGIVCLIATILIIGFLFCEGA